MRGPWRSALLLGGCGDGFGLEVVEDERRREHAGQQRHLVHARDDVGFGLSVSSVTTSLPPASARNLDPRHVGQGCADLGHVFGADVQDEARHVRLRSGPPR